MKIGEIRFVELLELLRKSTFLNEETTLFSHMLLHAHDPYVDADASFIEFATV